MRHVGTDKAEKILEEYFRSARLSHLFCEFYKEYPDYGSAPVLSKKELIPILKERFDLQNEHPGVYLVRSGGSTQNPLIFPVDIRENLQQRQVLANSLSKAGVFSPKTIALNIFGYSDMYRTAAIMDDVLERCQATSLPMSAHASYEDICHAAVHFKPDFIFGTPSKLLRLIEYLTTRKKQLMVPNLLFSGEFLRKGLQKLVHRTLGVKQVYSLYGAAETGIWGWCDFSRAPGLYRVIPGIVIEIEASGPEEFGRILVTNTYRTRFPVFRYAIGDLGRLVDIDGLTCLELKARESKSFILCEQHYDLEDFSAVVGDADAFQFKLQTSENLVEEIEILLVQEITGGQKSNFLSEKNDLLRKLVSYDPKWMKAEVRLVSAGELFIDPSTGKTPAILDTR
jgi:phenylacetate-CoA ligase